MNELTLLGMFRTPNCLHGRWKVHSNIAKVGLLVEIVYVDGIPLE